MKRQCPIAETSVPSIRDGIGRWIRRIGATATLLTALVLSAALIGNVLIHMLQVRPDLLLIAVVDLGPPLGVFLGNIATGVNYYGTWRILRGLDQYDVRQDAKSQAGNLSGMLNSLVRFAPALSASLLIASLILTILTLAPAQALGVDPQKLNQKPSSPPGQTNQQPTPSSPPSQPRHLQFTLRNATAAQQCSSSSALLPALTVTLDNGASNVDVSWRVSQIDSLSGAGRPWASADPTTGVVPASQGAALTLTLDPQLCSLTHGTRALYQARLEVEGGDVYTITDEIAPPPSGNVVKHPSSTLTPPPPTQPPIQPPASTVALAADPANANQTCDGAIAPYKVLLDTRGSNVPVTWTFSTGDTAPGGRRWATAAPAGDTIQPGATETITITPDHSICSLGGTKTTYHAILAPSGAHRFTALALADTITVKPHIALSARPLTNRQTCGDASFGPYRMTLDNTASNAAINWIFVMSGAAWAAASPSSGALAAGQTTQITITPTRNVCSLGSTTTYQAQIAPNGGYAFTALTLTDTITAPAVFAPTLDSPTGRSQSCTGPPGSYALTLDNTKSNVPVTWSFTAQEKARDGKLWASSSPTSGTVQPGMKQTIQVMPDPNATNCSAAAATTYHATITLSGGGQHAQITITDAIMRPA
jgi:hypothetical protein